MSTAVLWDLGRKVSSIPRRVALAPIARHAFASCGGGFYMGRGCDFQGIGNIHIGDRVSLGPRTLIWTTRAHVYIGDDVMFGPGVSIISGDHRIDIPGRPMNSIRADEKLPENDQDVVIEDDCWLGGGCVVLKGVTVAKGCVIAASAVVTRDTEPYGVYAGVPARRVADRFPNAPGQPI